MFSGASRVVRRSAAFAALAAWAAACTGSAPRAAKPGGADACDADHLDACEHAIAAALSDGRPLRPLVTSYVDARMARTADDGWSAIWRALAPHTRRDDAPPSDVVLICEGKANKPTAAERVACAPKLERPTAIGDGTLALAMADAAGYAHAFFVRGGQVMQLFPRDPLTPFMAGLPAVVRDDASLRRVNDDVALAASVRRAVDAAAASRYADAAHEADRLLAAIAQRDPTAETTLRARYTLQLLGAAAIALSSDAAHAPAAEEDPLAPSGTLSAVRAEDTPYGDLLRVRTARDERAAWATRGRRVLAALPPDRRGALEAALATAPDKGGGPSACRAAEPPPMAGARDLVFGWQLARAFASDAHATREARLPRADWYRRYDAMVHAVDASRSTWAYASMLLAERGAVPGLQVAATPTYQRVNELARRHLQALRALQQAEPSRFRPSAALPLVYSTGILADEALRDEIAQLTEATVRDKLSRATDPSSAFEAVLTGVLAGLSYPPAMQGSYFAALHAAFTAKMKSDLSRATGWSAAALFGADLAYRVATDPNAEADYSAQQIVRALDADPDLPKTPLGALSAAAARYLALGVGGELGPDAGSERTAARRAARDALRRAIAGLGRGPSGTPGDEPAAGAPQQLLDRVTDLADRLIAIVAARIIEARKPQRASCVKSSGPSPRIRRSLADLAALRKRITDDPAYRQGSGAWIRRLRMLVTIASDAIDVELLPRDRMVFAIGSDDAARALADALRDAVDRDAADAIAAGHALFRGYFEAKTPSELLSRHGSDARRVLAGVVALLRGEPKGDRVALLDDLAKVHVADADATRDASSLLVSYAKAFYDGKLADRGDLWLLGFLATAGATQEPPPQSAIDLATRARSRVEWPLRLLADVGRAKRGGTPDPASYEAAMRRALEPACASARADDVLTVMRAVRDYATGRRREARASLEGLLKKAEDTGLSVPSLTYRYEEKTSSKVLAITLGVSAGAGLLEGANTFSVGLGMKSPGRPEGSLEVSVDPDDAPRAVELAARYYVHAAALAAAYAFIDGDVDAGLSAASRAVGALASGVRLGPIRAAQNSIAWASDARAVLAIDAELAAEAGMPFLAGDLWTVVRSALGRDAAAETVRQLLHPLPLGLAAVSGLGPVVERTDRALAAVAGSLPCTGEKVDAARYEAPSCEAYPLTLSLRIADVLKKLPRLRAGNDACGGMRALDGFLGALNGGTYDPERLLALVGTGAPLRPYDAAVLLTRHRQAAHCGQAVIADARALGRSPVLDRSIRSDLLTVALNCAAGSLDGAVIDDLLELDDVTRGLPDIARNLHVVLAATDLAQKAERWDVIAKLADRSAFVDRWLGTNAVFATAALAIEHAAATLGTHKLDGKRAADQFDLLCATLPPGDGAPLCDGMRTLRAATTDADRRRIARELLKRVVAAAPRKP